MRWLRSADPAPHALDVPIDRIDPDGLEVLEADAPRRAADDQRRDAPVRELAYGRSGRDGTGIAGLWETIAGG